MSAGKSRWESSAPIRYPDPDVVVLEGVGHYPQLEAHDRVVDEYLAFRARLGH